MEQLWEWKHEKQGIFQRPNWTFCEKFQNTSRARYVHSHQQKLIHTPVFKIGFYCIAECLEIVGSRHMEPCCHNITMMNNTVGKDKEWENLGSSLHEMESKIIV